MKIRIGFVSNSSSASFICEVCSNKYYVESRGGEPDEWELLKEGLCENCRIHMFKCACYENFYKAEGLHVLSYGINGCMIYMQSEKACPKCFAVDDQFAKDRANWAKFITDPAYEFNNVEKQMLKYWNSG